jgi:hypothetical protein
MSTFTNMDSESLIQYLHNKLPTFITSNYKFILLSFIFLLVSNYVSRRYIKIHNESKTQIHTLPNEYTIQMSLNNLSKTTKYYIFWNGNYQSTYLLITYLQKNLVVQPIYIEEYKIAKSLDTKKFTPLLDKYQNMSKYQLMNKLKKDTNGDIEDETYTFLKYMKTIKDKQTNELNKLLILRKLILQEYPEFKSNLLPTQYVSSIQKDLAHTSKFYQTLKTINPLYVDGIEFIEQATRFAKHYTNDITQPVTANTNTTQNNKPTLIKLNLALTSDSKTHELTSKILTLDPSLFIEIKFPLLLMNLNNENIKINALTGKFYYILQETTRFT